MLQNRLKQIERCLRCGLSQYRKNVVIGRGSLPCDILFIGDAPGRTENFNGVAFDGQAGMLLNQMIEESGLNFFKLYFTNTILCRPCDSVSGETRQPTPEEVLYCAGNVQTIIEKAVPDRVVLMGDVAKKYFKTEFTDAYTIIHPATVLRTGGKQSPMYLATIRALEQISRDWRKRCRY